MAPWWRTGRTPARLHQPTQYRFYEGKNGNKPLDESTALYRGREPSERRFTLTCTQCTIGWSSLTRFNAQIYEVGC